MDSETRGPAGPMTQDEMIEAIKAGLGVNTLIEAVRKVSEIKAAQALKPIVSVDTEGRLHIAPMTVRQTVQLMTALEGLSVVA